MEVNRSKNMNVWLSVNFYKNDHRTEKIVQMLKFLFKENTNSKTLPKTIITHN